MNRYCKMILSYNDKQNWKCFNVISNSTKCLMRCLHITIRWLHPNVCCIIPAHPRLVATGCWKAGPTVTSPQCLAQPGAGQLARVEAGEKHCFRPFLGLVRSHSVVSAFCFTISTNYLWYLPVCRWLSFTARAKNDEKMRRKSVTTFNLRSKRSCVDNTI